MKSKNAHKFALVAIAATIAISVQASTPVQEVKTQEFPAAEYQNQFTTPTDPRPKRQHLSVQADELHFVGFYEGFRDEDADGRTGTARVKVSRPGKTVALVLTAYEPVLWTIECDETTTISHVILSGYHEQRVQANSALLSAKVVASSYDVPGIFEYFYFYESNHPELRETVQGLTGMKPSGLRCGYTAEGPIVIDGEP